MPLLELDDGRLLAESDAMLLYLAEGTRFLPADRYERGLAYQWLFFEQYSHEPYIAVRRALLVYPDRAKEATPERLASTLAGGEKALRVMEEQLPADAVLCRQCDERRRHRALRLYARRRDEAASTLPPIRRSPPGCARVEADPGHVPIDLAAELSGR